MRKCIYGQIQRINQKPTTNALFWHADAILTIPEPYKENYNGLTYIGYFYDD